MTDQEFKELNKSLDEIKEKHGRAFMTDRIDALLYHGKITPNEARKIVGLPRLAHGDTCLDLVDVLTVEEGEE